MKGGVNMFCGKGEKKYGLPHFLMTLSGISLVIAALVSLMGVGFWLAGTQWILVSIALAVYAIALDVHYGSCCDDDSCCTSPKKRKSSRRK